MLEGGVGVGQGLGLDPLAGIDDEDGPLAGGQRPRDLIGEVDVAGGVDEVELVGLAVVGHVGHAHRLGLDGDPPLPLQVEGVEHLVLHLPRADRSRPLQEAVGERRFAVIDVGNDREVADAAQRRGGHAGQS